MTKEDAIRGVSVGDWVKYRYEGRDVMISDVTEIGASKIFPGSIFIQTSNGKGCYPSDILEVRKGIA